MRHNGNGLRWGDGPVKRLTELWNADELSASQIALALNAEFTVSLERSAVIAKAHRLGLHGKRRISPDKRRVRKARKHSASFTEGRRVMAKIQNRAEAPPLAPEPIPELDDKADPQFACTIITLTDRTCRWPCGEPSSAEFRFCGRPEADMRDGRPYCAGHQQQAKGFARVITAAEREKRSRSALANYHKSQHHKGER